MTRVNFINALVAAASRRSLRDAAGGVTSASGIQQVITNQQVSQGNRPRGLLCRVTLDNQLRRPPRGAPADAVSQDAASGATLTLAGGATLSALGRANALLVMSMPEYQMN